MGVVLLGDGYVQVDVWGFLDLEEYFYVNIQGLDVFELEDMVFLQFKDSFKKDLFDM